MRTLERCSVESFMLFEMENTYSTHMSLDPKMSFGYDDDEKLVIDYIEL